MKLIKQIKALFKKWVFGLSKAAKKAVIISYDVAGVVKTMAENKRVIVGLDILADLIPGKLDDKLFAVITNDLPKVLTELLFTEAKVIHILETEPPEKQFKLAIAELRKATKLKKGSAYLETSAKVAEILSEHKLNRGEAITFIQGHHDSLKNEKINNEV